MPFLAVAAVAAGTAVATGVITAATAAYIGIGATVVGKLTKSKELMQIGAGISLGTGVAALGQSIFGGAEAVAGAGSASAGTAGAASTGAADFMAGATDQANSWVSASNAAAPTAGLETVAGKFASAPSTAPMEAVGADSLKVDSRGLLESTTASLNKAAAVPPPPGTDAGSIASWWSKQPEATKLKLLEMGGNAVGSMFDGWSEEEKMAFMRERQNLENQRYNQSVANANAQPTVARPTGGLLYANRGG